MSAVIFRQFAEILDLFYPSLCVGCETESVPQNELFCVACQHGISVTSLHKFYQNECTRRVPSINVNGASAMYRFYPGGIIQRVIHKIKYQNQPQVAYRFGLQYGHLLAVEPWINGVDFLLPVPLHIKRLRRRGFNQSFHFAKGLSESLGKPVVTDHMIRNKDTRSQTEKGRLQRLQNMQGVFQFLEPARIDKRHVLLVDDVLTTGATIEACLSTLQSVAEVELSFVTIAIAE